MKSTFIFVLAFATAVLGLRFDYDVDLTVNISLGTEAQGPFKFYWNPTLASYEYDVPQISHADDGGLFNPDKSKTFEPTEVTENQIVGFDTLRFQNGPALLKTNIIVDRHYDYGVNGGRLSLRRSNGEKNETFIERVLRELGGSKTVLLVVKDSHTYDHHGTLILGESQPEVCSTKWTTFNSTQRLHYQMTFPIDDVEIGKYHKSVSGELGLVLDSNVIALTAEIFAEVVRQFRVDIKTRHIDCEVETPIAVSAGALEFRIGHEDYRMEEAPGKCTFLLMSTYVDVITMPLKFFTGKCFRYDFATETISVGPII